MQINANEFEEAAAKIFYSVGEEESKDLHIKEPETKSKNNCENKDKSIQSKEIEQLPDKSTELKPKCSLKALIAMALQSSPNVKMTVQEISDYIIKTFPFYSLVNQRQFKTSLGSALCQNNLLFEKEGHERNRQGKSAFWKLGSDVQINTLKSLQKEFLSAIIKSGTSKFQVRAKEFSSRQVQLKEEAISNESVVSDDQFPTFDDPLTRYSDFLSF